MDLTPEQRRVVFTLGFCGLVSAADNWFVSPALPAIANALGVAASAATIVLTAYLVPYGLLQPVCGTLGDRFGRLRVLHVIVAGLAAGTFLCAVAPTLPLLVAARVVTGCFAAGIIAVSQAHVGDVVGPECRGAAVGVLMGITFTGQGLSSGLGGIITDLMSWRAAFACFGVLALVALALLWRLPRPAAPAGGEGAAPATPEPQGSFLSRAARIFFGDHRAIFFVACTTGIVFLGVYGFMGTFLSERCGLGPTQAGLVMMLYGVMCLAGGAVSGRIGAVRGPRGVICVGEASGLLAIATLVVVTATGAWQPALLAAGALGFGYILTQPTLVSLSMDADPAQTGLCTGLIGLGVFAGGGVGSALGGQLVALGGYDELWLAAGALLLAQLVLGGRALAGLARHAG
ncbi:MFS transporter [Olsenella sp. DSM 107455]|uniref:MFS transporter n=1 Tax=Thermophilibacter gallinarum TaxID=2779357 RepID=A0ABR9QTS5_9ACTN|nr:MFS transporter [Thermophilibacter gallinarum]MBE5024137.1 MFS transporter [Thermophilibacter gallinarum]